MKFVVFSLNFFPYHPTSHPYYGACGVHCSCYLCIQIHCEQATLNIGWRPHTLHSTGSFNGKSLISFEFDWYSFSSLRSKLKKMVELALTQEPSSLFSFQFWYQMFMCKIFTDSGFNSGVTCQCRMCRVHAPLVRAWLYMLWNKVTSGWNK